MKCLHACLVAQTLVAPILLSVSCHTEAANAEQADSATAEDSKPLRNESREAEYDDQGRLLTETFNVDEDSDGEVDRRQVITFAYDQQGRNISKEIDFEDFQDPELRFKRVLSFFYNADGLIKKEVRKDDRLADGSPDLSVVSEMVYRGGRVASKTAVYDSYVDDDEDRRERTTFGYTDGGHLSSQLIEKDNNSDGKFDARQATRYDYEAGRLVVKSIEFDDDNNGRVDRREVTRYSEPDQDNNFVATVEIDSDADGVVDRRDRSRLENFADGHSVASMGEKSGSLWLIGANVFVIVVLASLWYLKRS